jgi:hypothetical protein
VFREIGVMTVVVCRLLDSVRFYTHTFNFSVMIWVKFNTDHFFIMPLAVINLIYFNPVKAVLYLGRD